MLRKSLILKLFDAFSIQRWNDQIRPVALVEMDKNAHKMAIAYCLAKYEASAGSPINWHNLIRGGLFELLRRTVLTDIKSPIYRKLRAEHPLIFRELSQWVYNQLEPTFGDSAVLADLKEYLTSPSPLDTLSREILAASHIYASYWEFQIIQEASPDSQAVRRIENMLFLDLAPYLGLIGIRKLLDRDPVASFVDLFGQLRFQVRWGQTPRIPPTTVLGHSMMVACLSYLLTREIPSACDERLRNNFFGGLFHDLPESVTRDIISPVKNAVPNLAQVLSQIEKELVLKEIYPLLEPEWLSEFVYFTEDEFSSKIIKAGKTTKTTSVAITEKFDTGPFHPLDGELIKVADHLGAFLEANESKENGFTTDELENGRNEIRNLYLNEKKKVAGIRIDSIYKDF